MKTQKAAMPGIGKGNNPASRANLRSRKPGEPALKGAGRPRGSITRIQQIAKEYGLEVPTTEQIIECYASMLNFTEADIRALKNDKSLPIFVHIVAKELLQKRGFDVIEKMLDRVCGKPKQSTDITTNGKDIGGKIEVEIIDRREQVEQVDTY